MEIPVVQAMSFIMQYLAGEGITTEQSHDWKKFKRTFSEISGKDSPSGQFTFKGRNLIPSKSFWLQWSKDGKPIAVHALRLEDCDDETSLQALWGMQDQERAYGGGRIGTDHPPITKTMKGKVVYAGEFVMAKKEQGARLPTGMALLSFFVAELRWKPDWIYGFMNSTLVTKKGFHSRVGYQLAEPRGTHWLSPPKNVDPDDWIVAIDRNALVHRVAITAMSGLDAWTGKR